MDRGSEASSTEVPDLGPAPQRFVVDVPTVRQLIDAQFPQWSGHSLTPVRRQGWDNVTFRLGTDLLVRLPSAAEYALAVEKEHRWLPELAAHLPVPIPVPVGRGLPGAGYPFPWSIYRWIPGEAADVAAFSDPTGIAEDLAGFLEVLRRTDATDGPRPGLHNWFRGGTLRTYDSIARGALARLEGHTDVGPAAAVWDHALAAPWDGREVWFHGDLAPGNVLLKRGRVAAVIDFGTCGVGDPSCDLAVAWTLLDRAGRQVLRRRLDIDDPTWARGRGWALWTSLRDLAGAVDDRDEASAARARLIVDSLVEDFATSP